MALLLVVAGAQAATPAQQVQTLNGYVVEALQQLDKGNVAGAQAEFKEFTDGWPAAEASVRNQDRTRYRDIESKTTDVQSAFAAQPPDVGRIRSALQAQIDSDNHFIEAYGGPSASPA